MYSGGDMAESQDNITIQRKKIRREKSPDKSQKSDSSKSTTRFPVQIRVIAVLLFFLSILVLMSLISYSVEDTTNLNLKTSDIFSWIFGDEVTGIKAQNINNWLGITGALISEFVFVGLLGYSLILMPLFLLLWSYDLFRMFSVSDKLVRRTLVYITIVILISLFTASFQYISWAPKLSVEWSGTVGMFLAAKLHVIVGITGIWILVAASLALTLIIGTRIEYDSFLFPIIEKVKTIFSSLGQKIVNINFNKKDGVNSKGNSEKEKSNEPVSGVSEVFESDENISDNPDPDPMELIKRNFNLDINRPYSNQTIENEPEPQTDMYKSVNNDEIEKSFMDAISDAEPQKSSEQVHEETFITDKELTKIPENKVIDSEPENVPIEEITQNADQSRHLTVTVNEIEQDDSESDSPISTRIHDEEISFISPGIDLLVDQGKMFEVDEVELKTNAKILQEKLETFKIYIENLSVTPGPVVTQYEFVPAAGIKISKIESLSDDLAMALKARGIRIIAPIPGKGTIGIEIPNMNPSIVRFSSVINSQQYNSGDYKLPIALGKTISGDVFISDLTKMPHLLIAGSTGSGKSVGINTIITSLIFKKHPSEVKFVIVDPKKVELQQYARLKNHYLATSPDINDVIITNPKDAVIVLKSVVSEMEERYDILASVGQRNLSEYNRKVKSGKFRKGNINHRPMPYIVVIIDELADLMITAAKEVEEPITRLAQMARAVGIHLVVATQRPSVDVITGIIKANFPARMAYLVAQKVDSRTILDVMGAEQLLGNGDMLFLPNGSPKAIRIQNSFISTDEVEDICDFIGNQKGYSEPYMLPSLIERKDGLSGGYAGDRDPLFEDAARLIIRHQQGSVSLIQRRLKVGYARAGRIVDELEAAGVVGPFDGSKARQVLLESESDLEAII